MPRGAWREGHEPQPSVRQTSSPLLGSWNRPLSSFSLRAKEASPGGPPKNGRTEIRFSPIPLSLSLDGHFLLPLPPMIMMSLVRPSAFLLIDFQRRNREHGNVGEGENWASSSTNYIHRGGEKKRGGGDKLLAQSADFSVPLPPSSLFRWPLPLVARLPPRSLLITSFSLSYCLPLPQKGALACSGWYYVRRRMCAFVLLRSVVGCRVSRRLACLKAVSVTIADGERKKGEQAKEATR